jgi:glycine hydroxymethyltransferase
VVVNAVNFDKDWAWLNAVNEGEVILDVERPWVGALHGVRLRNLHDVASGAEQCLDIALQGPASLEILLACIEDQRFGRQVARLARTFFAEGEVGGVPVLVSRTGYTGEEVGYELYVHPDRAVELWRLLLERGAAYGIQPCGLAARDSTRIEAGLPLYGHELGGPLEISQNEAGFGYYVKYHKPFFVGRDPYKARNDASTRAIVRFQVSEHGARALRGGEPVVNRRGRVIGQVTSCALVGELQVGMALVEARYATPETALYLYPETRRAVSKAPEAFETGDTVALPVQAEVVARFPEKE